METTYLKEFVYLAETLSFKQTAEHFYVSRSVISRHLAALEETLGVKLVERSSHAVELTDVGRVFYRDAQIILRDYESALAHVRTAQNNQTRVVRIGYLRNAARPVIVPFVKYMQEHFPQIKLTMMCMEYSELRRSMEDGLVDIALAVNVNPGISKNYRSTHIYTDKFYAVMSKDHQLASRKEGISLDELPEDKLLLPDSFVYSGLSELVDGLVETQSQIVARAYYRDIDMLYLKVQTEGYVALSSSMNNRMFGDSVAIVPVRGIDSSFAVSAFYCDDLAPDVFAMCSEGFKACHDVMSSDGAAGAATSVGITLDGFK